MFSFTTTAKKDLFRNSYLSTQARHFAIENARAALDMNINAMHML
jgi:hypothetical protein